ncbi:hypothetical protein [Sorangium sp. So ce385]|uniref:hypothetical protein n=1 Tax=Sorangium sp. So ce385 TaxID=3133308 RepID=UPI003F5CB7C8
MPSPYFSSTLALFVARSAPPGPRSFDPGPSHHDARGPTISVCYFLALRSGFFYLRASAAGNAERHSYEARFHDAGRLGPSDGRRHDFDPGAGVDDLQRVSASAGTIVVVPFNWDQPSISANGERGSRSDMDLVFYHMSGAEGHRG